MQGLVEDLAAFTSLVKAETEKADVPLNEVVSKVLEELNAVTVAKQAVIKVGVLPVIHGTPVQLKMLFRALVDNALKFSKEGVPPRITVTYDRVPGKTIKGRKKEDGETQYHRITIADNGIGFDNAFGKKMFRIFQRLHTQQSVYPGKGVGLAIAERVMVNHAGFIESMGIPAGGAKFYLYFPIPE
jgi:light-regulated signal transduction histidine kinase (bacteriophytochrome)